MHLTYGARTVRFIRGTFPVKHMFRMNDVRQHLNVTFGKHWICRGGPVHWPVRSPDLSCLDFFCWGQMKTLVYETPVDSVEDTVARISVDAGCILSI
ncbi:hypothetical protein AVEN_142618-1 [Araneus ventricosus]|uniref:Uncharacterized protein n=1 Tax=Araneus ventricosus TaxID=182803 RepID=A0A4Y2G7Z7_ARAVE|nr:hypothetical protein AVEN_142618-1 [Araneus ventricosus]